MTKASQITNLLAQGKRVTEIAAIVGCGQAYVCVVKRRNAAGGRTDDDSKWHAIRMETYHSIPSEKRKAIRAKAKRKATREGLTGAAAKRRAHAAVDAEVYRLMRRRFQ